MHEARIAPSPYSLAVVLAAAGLATPALAAPQTHVFSGDSPNDAFGFSVAGAGDVNGDGRDDLIVGAPGDDDAGNASGRARVLSGADGSVLHVFDGESTFAAFGHSVDGAGDVNGDGFDDVIVGSPSYRGPAGRVGQARVLSGATGAVLHTFEGASGDGFFGWSVAGAGDVDADGFDDVIVGGPLELQGMLATGVARVYSGATGAVLHVFAGNDGDQLGNAVDGAGDVNGDGFDDVIVGSPGDDSAGLDTGRAFVFSGADGSVLHAFDGDAPMDQLGFAVAGAGDLDRDGFADLILGIPFNDNGGSSSGRVRVHCGATGVILFAIDGDGPMGNFGISVDGAGDLNADGVDDFVVGAPGAIPGTGPGSGPGGNVHVYSGANGDLLATIRGDAPDGTLGQSVAAAGDVDGDGIGDFIAGDPIVDGLTGRAIVYSYARAGGSPVGLSYCFAEENSTQSGAHLFVTGNDFVVNNDITLNCDSLPAFSAGFFLNSGDDGFLPSPGGSDGNLCILGPSIGRFVGPGEVQNSGAGGAVSLQIDLTRMPQPMGAMVVAPGQTWNFQYWYRDIGSTSNFSDAVRVTFR